MSHFAKAPKSSYNSKRASPSTASLLPPSNGRRTSPGVTHQSKFTSPSSLRRIPSNGHLFRTPTGLDSLNQGSGFTSISEQFSVAAYSPSFASNFSQYPESDDYIHNPDRRRDQKHNLRGSIFTLRGLTNLGCLILVGVGLVALFAGYPLISHFTTEKQSFMGGFNLGGINATGQVPSMPGNWGLIDLETPKSAYTKPSYRDPGKEMQLVFSDEFNVDGRSFYPGDDPYWEAVDLHYWATNNMEWYDPAAITTKNGALEITLSKKGTHGLQYEGGMLTTWNKLCFSGGLIETAVNLPGTNNIVGIWPAIWTMGNLGRAGYGASLEGMWPYTYDSCDVGTVPNQTVNGTPHAATVNGDTSAGGALSYLPGQRLSRCTCPGESHPGPLHADGTFVGRSAPEIDVFEAQVSGHPPTGQVSQSAQWAPFNERYLWKNGTDTTMIADATLTKLNPYLGGAFQQATSAVTETNQACYEFHGACFSVYGFEYKPGFDDAYISWIADGKVSWTLKQQGMDPDEQVKISGRPIPQEPLSRDWQYLIVNLGMSMNFGEVDLEHLKFPVTMRVDWIRVYQSKQGINVGCSPKNFPTEQYINKYIDAYTNPNLTTWVDDYKQAVPKNSFLGQC